MSLPLWAWGLLFIVVSAQIGAYRAKLRKEGRPVGQRTGRLSMWLFVLVFGFSKLGHTAEPWPWVVLFFGSCGLACHGALSLLDRYREGRRREVDSLTAKAAGPVGVPPK
jgi:hypothetical protein